MKTKSLFGFQFIKQPRYKQELLDNFHHWKIEKQRWYLRQCYHDLIYYKASYYHLQKYPDSPKGSQIYTEFLDQAVSDLIDRIKCGDVRNDEFFYFCDLQFHEVEQLLNDNGCVQYFITNSVLAESERLLTKEPYDLAWLQPIPEGKRQLNYGDRFIRFEKKGHKIAAIACAFTLRQDGQRFFEYTFFHFDLIEKSQTKNLISNKTYDYFDDVSSSDFHMSSRKLLFQLITFMELAPIEEVYLPAGRKHGTKKSDICLLNEEIFEIIIVHKNWNRNVHIGKIDVEAHYRLQPCGPGNKYRNLIYISDHYRNGYNISAGKLKNYGGAN